MAQSQPPGGIHGALLELTAKTYDIHGVSVLLTSFYPPA